MTKTVGSAPPTTEDAPADRTPVVAAAKVSALAIPLLGVLGGVQGTAPNIASTALVGASRALHMTGSTQALAASVQTMAIAATVITTGLLADRLGRRRVLMAALVVGAIGNLVVAAAPTSAIYMVGMAVTGVGLGAVYGAAFAYIKAVARPGGLAGAMGTFTAVIMLTTILLTFLGGTLSGTNWRLTFVLLPVICVVSMAAVWRILPAQPRIVGGSLDLVGQFLLGLGVISFLYSFSQFAESLTSPKTLVPLAVGIVLLTAFFIWESRVDGAFYPVSIFRSPVFIAALFAGFIYNFGTAASFLQVTNLWQYVNGLPSSKVALWQLPLLAAGIVAGFVTGRLMTNGLTNRVAILVGGVTTAAGMLLLALFHDSTHLIGFLPGLLLTGAGVVIAAVPFGNLILAEAPASALGPVSSSKTTVGQFFYTIGFSVSTVMIDRLTHGGVVHRLQHAGVAANQISTGLDAVNVYASRGTAPNTAIGTAALRDAVQSYGHAFVVSFTVFAVLMVAAAVAGAAMLRNGEPGHGPATASGPT